MTDADYRLMVESVRDYAIFMLDPDGCIRSWNAGAQRLKGYAPPDVTGRHFRLFYPPEQMTSGVPERLLHEALTHGRFEDEGWRIRKDGTRFWASVVVTALFDEQGVHRGFTKVTRDLTERREHEELLRQSEERFRLMVEGVRDYAIFMLDTQGRIASWNLGAQINKGYTAEEILGQPLLHLLPAGEARPGLAGVRAGGGPARRSLRGRGLAFAQGRQPLLGQRGDHRAATTARATTTASPRSPAT